MEGFLFQRQGPAISVEKLLYGNARSVTYLKMSGKSLVFVMIVPIQYVFRPTMNGLLLCLQLFYWLEMTTKYTCVSFRFTSMTRGWATCQ